MNLATIFEQLAYGELSQLFASDRDDATDGLRSDVRRQITAHVKMGLTELHKRLLLRERRVTLEMQEDKIAYVLDERFAQSNTESTAPVKYLLDDLEDPFTNSALFKVERISDEKGEELDLNDVGNPEAVRTPTYNQIILPDKLKLQRLAVVYRADHPKIDSTLVENEPHLVPIHLPATHLEALLYYIAMRYTTPNGISGEFHEGNNYQGKFEASIARLKALNYEIDKGGSNSRFRDNGWV